MQVMVIEFARHALGNKRANSTEFDPATPYPVIDLHAGAAQGQRHGRHHAPGHLPLRSWWRAPGRRKPMAEQVVHERHRHRYEFNNDYRDVFEQKGMIFSGLSPDGRLVEICELRDHPWMVACQFHPEFRSRPNRPHPLFRELHRRRQGDPRRGHPGHAPHGMSDRAAL